MVVYIDVIWLLNLCFDGLLLLLTAIFLKRNITFWRLVLGALTGSIIVILMVTPLLFYVSQPIIKLLFSFLMIWITFGFKRFRYFFQNVLTFYFVTFLIGGGIIGIHYFFKSSINVENGTLITTNNGLGDPISWLVVMVGFPLLWLFSRSRIEDIKVKKIQYDQIVIVKLELDEMKIQLKGLIDSGNQLFDPITKTPVMIMNIEKVQDILPNQIIELASNIDSLLTDFDIEQTKWANKIRIIPYRGIGTDQQFLLAIKPDKISILYENNWLEVKKGLIAFNPKPLSSDGDYECIIHPKMLMSNPVQPAS